MKTLLFVLLAGFAAVSDATAQSLQENIITLIPSTTAGVPSAVGKIVLRDLTAPTAKTVTIVAPNTVGTNYTLTLPTTAGTNLYYLQTNGSGVTTWAAGACATCLLTTGGQTITGDDTFNANILTGGGYNIGSTTQFWTGIFGNQLTTTSLQITDSTAFTHVYIVGEDSSHNFALTSGLYQMLAASDVTGANTFTFYNAALLPSAAGAGEIGSSSVYWGNGYITNLSLGITGSTQCLQANTSGVVSGTGAACVTASGYMTLGTTQTVTADKTFNANILTGGGYNIGSTSQFWSSIYANASVATSFEITNSTAFSHVYFIGEDGSNNFALTNGLHQMLAASDVIGVNTFTFYSAGLVPDSAGSGALGSASLPWANLYLNTALAGTFNMSGNETVTGNWYNRTFSGAPSCSGVPNGWQGEDTTNIAIDYCIGSTLYTLPLGSWPSYSSTVSNLTSPSSTCNAQQVGHAEYINCTITGTTTGTPPTFTVPVSGSGVLSGVAGFTSGFAAAGASPIVVLVSGTVASTNISASSGSGFTIKVTGVYQIP